MTARLVAMAALVAVTAGPPVAGTATSKNGPSAATESMSFKDRCMMASVLAKEVRDLLSWIDPRRLPGVLGDDGFQLLIVPGPGDEIRSLFARGEHCAFSLERIYPSPGKIQVGLAEDPPELLPPGRAYALLFMRSLARGRRWQFDWSLSASGYVGCAKEDPTSRAIVETCRHPGFMHGVPTAELRIVVARKGSGFEAEVANLEVSKWSASRSPPD